MRATGWVLVAAGAAAVGVGWFFAARAGELWVLYPLLGGFAIIFIGSILAISSYFVGAPAKPLRDPEPTDDSAHLAIVTPMRPHRDRPASGGEEG